MNPSDVVQSSTCVVPVMGLGTYGMRGIAGAAKIEAALDEGYRLVDSAVNYENEGAVGAAVRAAGESREDIFVTSKLPGRHHHEGDAIVAVEESLMRMGLDYLDLYLIHWPLPEHDQYVRAWEGLIAARDKGLVRHIGVSNFLPEHIERLKAETSVVPEVNQIEIHPFFPQEALVAFHAGHDIITQAWSPLGRGSGLLIESPLIRIASKHEMTPAQVVLCWHIERGVVPIPKSSSVDRMRENLDVLGLSLDDEDRAAIDGLARDNGRLWDSDPRTYVEL